MTEITWLAHYTDGSTIDQREGAKYPDIDRARLQAFDLWQDGRLLVRVDLRDDSDGDIGPKRLIWRIRRQVNGAGNDTRIHLVGWQRQVSGRNIQAINYVFEDGVILLGGQFRDNDTFMDSIVPLECEKDLAV